MYSNMFENELFQLLNDIDKDIDNIDYKRLRDYKTPFIIDRSKNEGIFYHNHYYSNHYYK